MSPALEEFLESSLSYSELTAGVVTLVAEYDDGVQEVINRAKTMCFKGDPVEQCMGRLILASFHLACDQLWQVEENQHANSLD